MSISLGILSFGVEADTKKLDKDISKSEKKISRFSQIGVQSLNSLSSFNINAGIRQINSLSNKLSKTERESQKTINQINELEDRMNKIKDRIAETSGLNIQYDKSQETSNRMTTTQYADKLDRLAAEDKEYQKILEKQIKLVEKSEEQRMAIGGINEKLALTNSNLEKAKSIQGIDKTINSISKGTKGIGNRIGNVIRNTLRWSSVLFGIGGAISLITRGVNSYLETNAQVKANLDYMVYAIGQALAPAIQWVVNLFQNLLGIIGAIAQVFFGVNLFANSLSNYMKSVNKNSAGTKKNLGSLAGFDEINNIGGDTTTNGVGVTMPDIPDLANTVSQWIPTITRMKEVWDEWKWAILGVVGALGLIKLGSVLGLAIPLIAGIAVAFTGVTFIIQGLYNMITGDFQLGISQFAIGIALLGLGILIAFGPIPALIAMIAALIIGLVVMIVAKGDEIKAKAAEVFGWITGFLRQEFTQSFGEVFGATLNGVFGWLADIVDLVKLHFNGCIDFIQGIFTGNWEQAWNGLVNIVKSIGGTILKTITAPFTFAWSSFESFIAGWNSFWNNIKIPNIKMPHFSISYEYTGAGAKAAQFMGLPGWPKFSVNWYRKGGVFDDTSIIGVGEYAGAKSNPEIAAPQSLIYQTTTEAIRDTRQSTDFNNNRTEPSHFTINVGNRKMFDDFVEYARDYKRNNGVSIFAD